MSISDKLTAIAENESKVFQAGYGKGCYDLGYVVGKHEGYDLGYDVGKHEGYDIGYDMGKHEGYDEGLIEGKYEGAANEYNEFWHFFQQDGALTNYAFAFCGKGWNDSTFKPKYPIAPVGSAHSIFRNCAISDLEALFQKCGSYLDTSKTTTLDTAFAGSTITHVGKIDTNSMGNLNNAFSGASKLETIDELYLSKYGDESRWQKLNNTFLNCHALKNITVTGFINYDINLQWSTSLTPESMKSIILHLRKYYEYSPNAYTYTVTFAENCWNALETDSKSPSGSTWREYVDSLGWLT